MSKTLEFWFDISCPYAYLASTEVEALAKRTGSLLIPRPILLGGVLRYWQQPQHLAGSFSPAKAKHNAEDLERWAQRRSVPLVWPEDHPMRTVDALRCLLVVPRSQVLALAKRMYRAYWVEAKDLSLSSNLEQVLAEAGFEPGPVLEASRCSETKDRLREVTEEGVAKGIFGVPAFFVGDELYWGQDRMTQVEAALDGVPTTLARLPVQEPVDFWFDYSSPFAYLASTRVEGLFGEQLRYRPMLLGAVFKAVGAPNVPLFAMSEAKRSFHSRDIQRQAEGLGLSIRWPTRFPLRTVLPLRVTLLAGSGRTEEGRALIHRFFRAAWVEDLDLAEPAVIRTLCDEVGLDGSVLVEQASQEEAKRALFSSTEKAVEAGVFGAPTVIVGVGRAEPRLYWGNDRLELAYLDATGSSV